MAEASDGLVWLDQRAAEIAPDSPEKSRGAQPFDLSEASVGEFLDNDPPPREMLVEGLIPRNVVGVLAAAGKTGKSMALLQLAVSACTGRPWLGMEMGCTGSVLILSAEDDRLEVWRRLRAVIAQLEADAEYTALDRELLKERLHVLDRVGDENRLTAQIDGQLVKTAIADRIIATAQQLPGPVLIAVDPLSRFSGGEPANSDDATRLVEVLERIRVETNSMVMVPHHTNKASAKDGDPGLEAVRDSSGLVYGVRWVGMLQKLSRDQASKYGIAKEKADWYVRFTAPGVNYCAPCDGMWLERQPGGVLTPTELEEETQRRHQDRAEDRYREALPKLTGLVRQHQERGDPLTRNRLRDYAGQEGIFGVGDQSLRGILSRAIAEGHIREHDTGERKRGKELRTW